MIELGIITNYGVLGLWTAVLLHDKYAFLKGFKEVMERNTRALELLESKIKK